MEKRAVVLCSGGVDSACAALLAKQEGYGLLGIHFKRPRKEFEAFYAKKFADKVGFSLLEIECDLTSLIRQAQAVQPLKYETADGDIWEFLLGRNFVYLTLAANFAVSSGANTIVVGFAPHDAVPSKEPLYADYPDCHKDILTSFSVLLSRCLHYKLTPSVSSIRIWAPLFSRVSKKSDVFRLALTLGVDLEDTITCYTPQKVVGPSGNVTWVPCGECLACVHKKRALEELQEVKENG